jgi:hypothetical protein
LTRKALTIKTERDDHRDEHRPECHAGILLNAGHFLGPGLLPKSRQLGREREAATGAGAQMAPDRSGTSRASALSEEMTSSIRTPAALAIGVVGVMTLQSALGLLLQGQYRDAPWIKATWFGNDWVTLAVAVPTMTAALVRTQHGSTRWFLVWLGMLGYAVYNYGFYMFGAALNAFFAVYVAAVLLSSVALVQSLARTDLPSVAASFPASTPVRAIGGYLTVVGIGLAAGWLMLWAAYVFAGRPTPVDAEAFKIVAAMDLAIMAPALICGGVWLWKRSPWGYVVAPMAGVQASLYVLVLSLTSLIAIERGW